MNPLSLVLFLFLLVNRFLVAFSWNYISVQKIDEVILIQAPRHKSVSRYCFFYHFSLFYCILLDILSALLG